jgi:hypothetical protein
MSSRGRDWGFDFGPGCATWSWLVLCGGRVLSKSGEVEDGTETEKKVKRFDNLTDHTEGKP